MQYYSYISDLNSEDAPATWSVLLKQVSDANDMNTQLTNEIADIVVENAQLKKDISEQKAEAKGQFKCEHGVGVTFFNCSICKDRY